MGIVPNKIRAVWAPSRDGWSVKVDLINEEGLIIISKRRIGLESKEKAMETIKMLYKELDHHVP